MKNDPRAACGQEPRPTNDQMNRCLPFCGLGAQEYVQGRAASCGLLQPEPLQARSGELSGDVTES